MTEEERQNKISDLYKLLHELIEEDGSLNRYKDELKLIEDSCDDEEGCEIQKLIDMNILECLEVFSLQGHSGFTAGYVNNIMHKLIQGKPLSPLQGTDEEWMYISIPDDDYKLYMNRRYSKVAKRVYKDGRSECYDSGAIICTNDNGKTWFSTNKYEKTNITFPYTVKDPVKYYLDEDDEIVKIVGE